MLQSYLGYLIRWVITQSILFSIEYFFYLRLQKSIELIDIIALLLFVIGHLDKSSVIFNC